MQNSTETVLEGSPRLQVGWMGAGQWRSAWQRKRQRRVTPRRFTPVQPSWQLSRALCRVDVYICTKTKQKEQNPHLIYIPYADSSKRCTALQKNVCTTTYFSVTRNQKNQTASVNLLHTISLHQRLYYIIPGSCAPTRTATTICCSYSVQKQLIQTDLSSVNNHTVTWFTKPFPSCSVEGRLPDGSFITA